MEQDSELETGRVALIEAIEEYARRHRDESVVTERFLDFLRREPRCFERHTQEGHVTGSAWVVDGRLDHILLTHHRKLDKWLQLGGHADGDHDIVRVALTEAREESGIDDMRLLHPMIFDLDVHVIPARSTDPEHLHYDVRYVIVAGHSTHVVSAESHDLSWVPLARITDFTHEESMLRMADKWKELSELYR
jgi:8-oxo-dGTP pyrophosphatase MutT (NUDIX family)